MRNKIKLFGKKYQRKQHTSTVEQELPNSEVRILIYTSEEVSVIENLSISMRKGKRSCIECLISQYICVDDLSNKYQTFIVAIDTT